MEDVLNVKPEDIKTTEKPKKVEKVKDVVNYNISKTYDLDVLKTRMKVRYGAKFIKDADTKIVFENEDIIIELIKQ